MRKRRTRKFLAMLLALVTVVTAVLGTNYSAANAASGPADGQVEYVGGTNSATGNYDIEVSKTIEEVAGKENYFDITLKTTTHRHIADMSTDIVLVLDISNTMNDDSNGNTTANDSAKKLTYAKNATNTFIKKFATNTNLDTNRKIGVVTFNRDANVVVPMTEANDLNDYVSIESKVKAITAPTGNDIKWTNIQGGLKLAENLLEDSTAKYKYVILMTDGFPTTYLKDANGTSTTSLSGYNPVMGGTAANATSSYNTVKAETNNGGEGNEGYFANTRVKAINYGGTSYSNRAAEKAQATAKAMKDSGINIFSVGVALASQNLSTMWSYIIDTTGMTSNEAYAIGNTTASYKNWLENQVAGGLLLSGSENKYSDAYNQTQLESDFENIMYDIEHAPPTTMREFKTIDPMSGVADFIGFYDKDGNLAADPNQLIGESKQNAENTAVYTETDDDNGVINWNMLQSGYTMDGDNLVFTLKYRVRLMNESEGFAWNSTHKMNGWDDEPAELQYSQQYEDTGEDVPDGSGSLDYPTPETEGYKGSLKFQKIDSDTKEVIAGVEFTLQHYGESCSVCTGDAVIADVKATSDNNGYVEFDNIPSGHEYYLIEKEPDGYAPVHNSTVIVSYGDTYIGTKSAENKLVDGKLNGGSGEAFVIENSRVEPVEIQIQASKSMNGNEPEAGAFQFQIKGKDVDGADHHEIVSNDADGIAKFTKIVFDKPGNYEFKVSEITGADTGIVYDDTVHTVKIAVSETSDETAYQAKVTVDNGTEITYVGKDNTVETVNAGDFANATRGEASAELKAKKVYTDGTLEAGDFSFKLTAVTENAPLPENITATNDADGKVSFGTITYTTPGTYEYEISEVNGGDKSIVYDDTVYKAVVTVTAPEDLTNGAALTATVKYTNSASGAEAAVPAFNNKDREIPTISMKGYKSLNGKDAGDQAFTFVFQEVNVEGNKIDDGISVEIKNGENGVIDFDATLETVVAQMINEVNNGKSASHFYKIYEKAGSDAAITYDDVYYMLHLDAFATVGFDYYQLTAILQKIDGSKIETVYSHEKGSAISIQDNSAKPVVNFANTSKVTLDLEATKVLISDEKTLKEGDYTFILEDVDGNQKTATNDANGKVQFETIEFTATDVGTHSYVIYEVEGDDTTLFYDDSLYTVTVTVAVDANGNLTISEPTITDEYDKSFTKMEFVNKDITPTHLHLRAKKTVNGATPTVAQQFSFQLINADTNEVIETIHNVHETVAFTEIEHNEAGTYNYIIKEVLPETDEDTVKDGIQSNGFTYDETEYKIQVIVTANEGVLEKKVTVNGKEDPAEHNTVDAGTFENSYEAKSVSVTLDGNKKLTGRDLASGEFNFVLTAVTENAPMPVHDNREQNDKIGNFKFDEIIFTKPGVYEYTVKEEVPEDAVNNVKDGVAYDTTVYNVKIEVTDNGMGNLVATKTVNGSSDTAIKFENDYNSLPTAVSITADKSLSGRTIQNGEFSFRLVEVDSSNNEIPGTEQIVTNGTAAGTHVEKVYFDSIIYDAVGTHTYKISEVIPADADKLGGVTYDTVVYTVIVKITDNGKGQLMATVDGKRVNEYDAGEFANRYEADEVTVNPEVTKSLTGRDWREGDSFSFTLTPAGTAATEGVKAGTVTLENTKVTINYADADKKASFGDITFTEAGTYYFIIAEEAGSLDNIDYDSHTALLRVTVSDDLNGKLAAEEYYRDSVTFNNTYTPDGVSVNIKGTKSLVGRDLNADEFSFVLKDADGKEIQTVTNSANGTFSFDAISYDETGTYKYTVSEEEGSLAGVTYDKTVYDVTVEVTYDPATGLLDPEVTYAKDETAVTAIKFENDYTPEGKEVSITAKKVVTPSDGNSYTIKAEEFQFGITPAQTNPANDPIKHQIVTNDAAGNVTFANATYTEPGTYIYTINEIDTGLGGIIYDDSVYRVTVVVTDDPTAAKLDANVTINKVDANGTVGDTVTGITFNNGYDPTEATAIIHGHKVLDSEHKNLEAGEFTFKLEAVTDRAPMPAGSEDGIATVTNTAAGVYQFGVITYDRKGTYEYKVSEVNAGEPGYTYDTTVHTVTVAVTDDNNGVLAAEVINVVSQEDNLANKFTNEYEPKSTDLTIKGSKKLTGRDLNEDEFSFVLKDAAGTEIQTVQNTENGTFSFDKISYTKAGTYKYTVSEVKGNLDGVAYDKTVYDVTVVVTDDGGELSAVQTYKVGDTTESTIVFNNKYTPADVEVRIEGTKVLEGRDLKAGEFSFVLNDKDGKEIQTVQNNVNGTFSFDAISYEKTGTYEYTVSEEEGSLGGVTYDKTVYNVTVDVTDNKEGKLVAKTTIKDNGAATGAIEFVNKYKTNSTNLTLQIEKDFQVPEERGWLENDVFDFELVGFDDNAKEALEESTRVTTEVSISERGKPVNFGQINLNKVGTYRFEIREKAGDIQGVNYDDTIYKVRVDVEDDGNGNLEIVLTRINGVEVDTLQEGNVLPVGTFVNTYNPAAVSEVLKGTKHLTGRDLNAGEFEFGIKAINEGDPLPESLTTSHDAEGNIVFGEIKFTKPGEYQYKIFEKDGNVGGITYDEEDIIATVKVGYDNEGELKVNEISYNIGDKKGFAFYNTYNPAPTTVGLKGKKILNGRPILATDEFTFTIQKAEGTPDDTPMPLQTTVTADINGEIVFGAMPFTKVGTYQYVIKEKDTGIAGVTFDRTEIVATITIEDDYSKGELVAKVEYSGTSEGGFVFTNTYDRVPTDPITISATKTVSASEGNSYTVKGGEFTFEITPAETNPTTDPIQKHTVTNDVNGNVIFAEAVEYTAPGNYVYGISEIAGDQPGITYDGSDYTLTVNVTDDYSGKLKSECTIKKGDTVVEKIEFENSYDPKEVEVTISGKKTLEGKDLVAGKFQFQLTAVDGAPMPASGNDKVTNTEAGLFSFDPITYDRVGTYKYTVTEVRLDETGYTYDRAEYNVTVVVSDHVETQIEEASLEETEELTEEAAETEGETPEEENAETEGEAPAEENTEIEGEVPTEENTEAEGETPEEVVETEGETPAEVVETEGEAPAEEVTTEGESTNEDAQGAELNSEDELQNMENVLGGIEIQVPNHESMFVQASQNGDAAAEPAAEPMEDPLTEPATEPVEDPLTEPAAEPVEDPLTEPAAEPVEDPLTEPAAEPVEDPVVEDGSGVLKAEVIIEKDTEAVEEIVFNNKYKALPVNVILQGTKELTGRTLKDGEFTFLLTDVNNQVAKEAVNEEGKFTFEITFTEEGTYSYTITEKPGALGGVTYDGKGYQVQIDVTDVAGQLTAEVTYADAQGTEVDGISFENSYKPYPASLVLSATKVLEGRTLKADEFKFALKDADGNVLQTKTNAADGSITFDALKYEDGQEGEYLYTINEVEENATGITYDKTVYTVVVVVEDNEEGSLVTKIEEVETNVKHVGEFKNTYKVPPVSVRLKAEKVLKGGTLEKGQFTFILEDASGNIIDKVTNDAEGNIEFSKITFDKAGEYAYFVSEVKGEDDTIIYDETVYKVLFKVKETDKLSVTTVIYNGNKGEVDDIEFVNRIPTPGEDPETPGEPPKQTTGTQTGDNSNILLWGAALVLAGVSAAGIGLKKKKDE